MKNGNETISVNDAVVITSDSEIYSDIRGMVGTVESIDEGSPLTLMSVAFEGGHVFSGLPLVDFALHKKSEWSEI